MNETKSNDYDHIIVRGSPAGFALAEQLSRNPSINVILLGVGPDGSELENVFDPGLEVNNEPSSHVWDYFIVPQESSDGLTPTLAQGKLHGGGAAINTMNYNRGLNPSSTTGPLFPETMV